MEDAGEGVRAGTKRLEEALRETGQQVTQKERKFRNIPATANYPATDFKSERHELTAPSPLCVQHDNKTPSTFKQNRSLASPPSASTPGRTER